MKSKCTRSLDKCACKCSGVHAKPTVTAWKFINQFQYHDFRPDAWISINMLMADTTLHAHINPLPPHMRFFKLIFHHFWTRVLPCLRSSGPVFRISIEWISIFAVSTGATHSKCIICIVYHQIELNCMAISTWSVILLTAHLFVTLHTEHLRSVDFFFSTSSYLYRSYTAYFMQYHFSGHLTCGIFHGLHCHRSKSGWNDQKKCPTSFIAKNYAATKKLIESDAGKRTLLNIYLVVNQWLNSI